MKFLYLISAVFLMSLLSCTSCNGNTTETDSDKSENPDIVNDQDSLSEEENDLISDSDSFDADSSEESPDIDNAECLPAHIDAGYPYYRNDGSIHFCRAC
ncbi:MAG TPA: hypothetical protein PLT70_08655, partial [bacterium]|nr:hypothetical protein [bacterium]